MMNKTRNSDQLFHYQLAQLVHAATNEAQLDQTLQVLQDQLEKALNKCGSVQEIAQVYSKTLKGFYFNSVPLYAYARMYEAVASTHKRAVVWSWFLAGLAVGGAITHLLLIFLKGGVL